MVVPRKPKHLQRIIRRAKTESAKADLEEYDRLMSEEMCLDPSVKLSGAQKKKKLARQRRLRLLDRRLFKGSR
jgi:hypothetical protein